MRQGIVIIGTFASIFLGGCASAYRLPLSDANKQAIRSTDPLVGLRQQEVGTTINPSNIAMATGGGLIPALIDAGINNSRAKKAEALAAPIRDALVTLDLGKEIGTSLDQELPKIEWLKTTAVTHRFAPDVKQLEGWVKVSKSENVLFLHCDAKFAPEFTGLSITVNAVLIPVDPKSKPEAKAQFGLPPFIYLNSFGTTVPAAFSGSTPEERVTRWAENGGAEVRRSISEATKELVKMLIFDLNEPGTIDRAIYKVPKDAEDRVVQDPNGTGLGIRGYVVKHEGSHEWVRLPDGRLVSTQ